MREKVIAKIKRKKTMTMTTKRRGRLHLEKRQGSARSKIRQRRVAIRKHQPKKTIAHRLEWDA